VCHDSWCVWDSCRIAATLYSGRSLPLLFCAWIRQTPGMQAPEKRKRSAHGWRSPSRRSGSADAAITYLFAGTDDPQFEAGEIGRTAVAVRECERVGLPLMVETIARGPSVQDPLSPEWMKLHTRLAVELGANLIETEYTGDSKTTREASNFRPSLSSSWVGRAKAPTARRSRLFTVPSKLEQQDSIFWQKRVPGHKYAGISP
jgi:hypothetical protein